MVMRSGVSSFRLLPGNDYVNVYDKVPEEDSRILMRADRVCMMMMSLASTVIAERKSPSKIG